jgi:hypothetical protein
VSEASPGIGGKRKNRRRRRRKGGGLLLYDVGSGIFAADFSAGYRPSAGQGAVGPNGTPRLESSSTGGRAPDS